MLHTPASGRDSKCDSFSLEIKPRDVEVEYSDKPKMQCVLVIFIALDTVHVLRPIDLINDQPYHACRKSNERTLYPKVCGMSKDPLGLSQATSRYRSPCRHITAARAG